MTAAIDARRAADPKRLGGLAERAVRDRLELRVRNRVGLPAEPLPCAFARARPARTRSTIRPRSTPRRPENATLTAKKKLSSVRAADSIHSFEIGLLKKLGQ